MMPWHVSEMLFCVSRPPILWRRIKGQPEGLERKQEEHLKTAPEANVKETARAARNGGILGYARVSTADQDVAGQEDRLRQAGAIRVFVDVISGRQFQRPGLSALIDHARPGDSLCVTRLDRLGRSLKELLETVEDLRGRDIHLVSLEERIDTTSAAAGELVFHVFGAIAHFERTRDGITAARKRRRKPGRPPRRSPPRRPLSRPV